MNSSIFHWKTLAIASSALIILFIGGFLISGNQPVHSQQTIHNYTASVVAANPKTATKIDPTVTITKPKSTPHKKTIKKTVAKAIDTTAAPQEQTPMDEMVVMGMAAGDKAIAKNNEAHPKTGWIAFENYLKDKALTPDGRIGTVKVSFTVNNDGSCTDFKIKSGLTEASDKKAIELIKNGPQWLANATGETKETTVDVLFH